MAYDFNGSTQYFTLSSGVVTAVPLTLACWFNNDSSLATRALVVLSDSGGSNGFRITTSTSRTLRAVAEAAGSTGNAETTATFSNTTWNHACGVFASATSRTVYLNGGNAVSNTTSRTPSGINRTRIGVGGSASDSYMNGLIAEVGIWNTDLTAAEVASLGDGVSPALVRPRSLVLYMPLIRGFNDLIGARVFTAAGSPTVAAHTRVYA